MEDLDEIVAEFLVESHENLDQLDRDLVDLEQQPDSRPLLGSIFRTIHTIKGTSGFLGYSRLEAVTHVGESLLSKLRDGELALTPEITGVLLELVDAVRSVLGSIEEQGGESGTDHSALIARLAALQSHPEAALPTEPDPPRSAVGPDPAPLPAGDEPADPYGDEPEPALPLLGDLLVQSGLVRPEDVTVAILEQQAGNKRRLGEILVDHGRVDDATVARVLEAQSVFRRSAAERTIRVDVDLLDDLLRLVGELVLTRNEIAQHAGGLADPHLTRASQRLTLLASELQEGVRRTRMQPVDHVWSKLTRVVRDLAVTCGKQVRLEMHGRDTELDRTVLEAVKDPLTHLVRNCVDHGIEAPEVRVAAGKAPEGTVLLRACHEGGQVTIEISDDGAGIDPRRVAARALERELVTPDEVAGMSARQLTSMVFLPGLSTASAVTNVSGRGVGTDVVKTNVEAIGGTVDVQSRVGWGTTFRIRIPLTLAIIPALVVRCAGDRYAIPQVSLVELVRLEGPDTRTRIEQVGGAQVLRLRDSLLPLVHLDAELGVAADPDRRLGSGPDVVVLEADDRRFGLVVDEVLDTEEIVVKPLGSQLKGIRVYSGATVLGDGRVALILDALALAHQARVPDTACDRGTGGRVADVEDGPPATEALLVVALEDGGRVALPLSAVARLEEFPRSAVERVGSREVVQYRGRVLPLVDLSSHLGGAGSGAPVDRLQVVVHSEDDRWVGLVVDRVVDVVDADDEAPGSRSDLGAPGLLGSVVVRGELTGLLDLRQAVLAADPGFYSSRTPAGAGA